MATNIESVYSGLYKYWTKLVEQKSGTTTEFDNFEMVDNDEDDLVEIKTESQVKIERDALKKFARNEQLAHDLAYQDLKEGDFRKIQGDDGVEREHRCHVIDTKGGAKGYLFLPTSMEGTAPVKAILVFRGTADANDVFLDAERGGAGATTFETNKRYITSQINKCFQEFNEANPNHKIEKLGIGGHSLGGATAQNCEVAMMEEIAANLGLRFGGEVSAFGNRDQFANLSEIELFTCNSANVSQDTADKSKILATYLAEKRQLGKTNLKIKMFDQRTAGDGVQGTGQAHVLSDVSEDQAEVRVLKADIGVAGYNRLHLPTAAGLLVGGALTGPAGLATAAAVVGASAVGGVYSTAVAHTTCLHEKPMEVIYERYDNTTPEGRARVKEELSNVSTSLNVIHSGAAKAYDGAAVVCKGVAAVKNSVGNGVSSLWSDNTYGKATPAAVKPVIPPAVLTAPAPEVKKSVENGGFCLWGYNIGKAASATVPLSSPAAAPESKRGWSWW